MTFRSLSLCALAASTLLARAALAQQMGPVSGAVAPSQVPTVSPENGLLVGDHTLLHGGVTVEGGYDSNVFYNDKGASSSGLLRVSPFLELTNTARNGEIPSGLFFDLRALLTYREYLTSDTAISHLRSFTPVVSANVEHNSKGTLALGFTDTFARLQDAPYFRSETSRNIVRDNNLASAQLRWAPGGGRLQGVLRLTNIVDQFESDSNLTAANSMSNEAMLDVSWRWLPKTALYLQVRQGYVFYFTPNGAGADALTTGGKKSSFPLRAVVGIRGLMTEKTAIALAVGYQNAFYSGQATTGGFLGSAIAAAELTIMPIFATKIVLGLRHDFQNSVLGNFYYNDGAYASLSYQTAARLVGQIWASYDHRQYHGLPPAPASMSTTRIDNLLQAGAVLDYYLKTWAFAGVSYSLTSNQSDSEVALSGATYTKHLVLARVGLTY